MKLIALILSLVFFTNLNLHAGNGKCCDVKTRMCVESENEGDTCNSSNLRWWNKYCALNSDFCESEEEIDSSKDIDKTELN